MAEFSLELPAVGAPNHLQVLQRLSNALPRILQRLTRGVLHVLLGEDLADETPRGRSGRSGRCRRG